MPPVNLPVLEAMFRVFSDVSLGRAQRNTGAYANEAYDLTDVTGKKYVLRVLRTQRPDTVELEAQMQTELISDDILTPLYLAMKDGTHLGRLAEDYFTLSEYIDGEIPTTASLALVTDFGKTLAAIHDSLGDIVVPVNSQQWLIPENAQASLRGYTGPNMNRLAQLISQGDQLFASSLPLPVIHADLWLGNVFAEHNTVSAVFDMEKASNSPRILDIARTYLSMRRETAFPAEQLRVALFTGYNLQATESLSSREEQLFQVAVAYTAGVCGVWLAQYRTEFADAYLAFGEDALV